MPAKVLIIVSASKNQPYQFHQAMKNLVQLEHWFVWLMCKHSHQCFSVENKICADWLLISCDNKYFLKKLSTSCLEFRFQTCTRRIWTCAVYDIDCCEEVFICESERRRNVRCCRFNGEYIYEIVNRYGDGSPMASVGSTEAGKMCSKNWKPWCESTSKYYQRQMLSPCGKQQKALFHDYNVFSGGLRKLEWYHSSPIYPEVQKASKITISI